ncbi:hypothetical protein Tco_0381183 [Tanacetum coccineum]
MRDAMPIMYQATLSLPTDLQKKLKKGQTQGEVGDAGEVKENVAKKKKVKVVEPKDCSELKGLKGWGKRTSRENGKRKKLNRCGLCDRETPLSNESLMYVFLSVLLYTSVTIQMNIVSR